MAVTQTPISARIQNEVLWRINQETQLGYYTRNRILNKGASLFLDLQDVRREYRAHPQQDIRRKIVNGFLMRWFPEFDFDILKMYIQNR